MLLGDWPVMSDDDINFNVNEGSRRVQFKICNV